MSFWTDDQRDFLREIFARGPHSWMAEEINTRFGTKYTKNAVVSQCHKLHLMKVTPEELERSRLLGRKARRMKMDGPGVRRTPFRLPAGDRGNLKLVEMFDQLSGPGHLGITFDELEAVHCRFPKGEGAAITYCGQPVLSGRSYCAHCHAICYEPSKPREHKVAA